MGTAKIVLISMKTKDLDLLLEELKKSVLENRSNWIEGPYPAKHGQGQKYFITFEVNNDDSD